ncbi:MAG TPA: DUF2393 family protein [Terracidiphilus sp.]|nr:DUF2393 family protein [Terracidiphilus sp.]
MSTGPQLVRSPEPHERNWLPLLIAAGAVLIAAIVAVVMLEQRKGEPTVTPVSAAPDAYAASLPITDIKMSESSNLAGGKVTYIDGHIANNGNRTVAGISAQVLFRNVANEVAQNETQPLKWIRTRDPYVDLEPVSAAPLKPGEGRDFRLIFDAVTQDWNGVYPQIRIVRVDAK